MSDFRPLYIFSVINFYHFNELISIRLKLPTIAFISLLSRFRIFSRCKDTNIFWYHKGLITKKCYQDILFQELYFFFGFTLNLHDNDNSTLLFHIFSICRIGNRTINNHAVLWHQVNFCTSVSHKIVWRRWSVIYWLPNLITKINNIFLKNKNMGI